MLLANMRVAQKIASTFPDSSLLRNHVAPFQNKLEKLGEFCKTISCPLDTTSTHSLSTSLDLLKADPVWGPRFEVLQLMSTKCLRLATYFCTGDLPESEWHHTALNMDAYTHFTSPIRRYPDLVVHRLLEAAILIEEKGLSPEVQAIHASLPSKQAVSEICEISNEKKYSAKKAGEQSQSLFLALLLKNNPIIVDTIVLSLGKQIVTFVVPCFATEQKVYLEDLELNHFTCAEDESKVVLYWPSSPGQVKKGETESSLQQTIQMFDPIKLRMSCKVLKNHLVLSAEILHPSLSPQATHPPESFEKEDMDQ